jgi:hypothetical protein
MTSRSSHLQLLAADLLAEPVSGLGPAVGVPRPVAQGRRAAPGRPWDELAPWWLPEVPAVACLGLAAARMGISFDVAVAVTVERSLAVRDLESLGDGVIERLDEAALSFRLDREVGGACAVYLRQLSGGQVPTGVSAGFGPVSVPARLAARLAQTNPADVPSLVGGQLSVALAWERAAVSHARTIGEWGACEALRLLGDQAARPSAAPHPTDS